MEWLNLYTEDGACFRVKRHEESRIDAAVEMYLSSSCVRDSLLHLDGHADNPIVVRASTISGWSVTTPEIRERIAEADAAMDAEERELRMRLGLPYDG